MNKKSNLNEYGMPKDADWARFNRSLLKASPLLKLESVGVADDKSQDKREYPKERSPRYTQAQLLEAARAANMDPMKMGEALGLYPHLAQNHINKLKKKGLLPKAAERKKEFDGKAIALIKEGKSNQSICIELGICAKTLSRMKTRFKREKVL
jgi:hypothetical protein